MSDPSPPMVVPERLRLLAFAHSAFQYLYAGSELGLFELLKGQPGLSSEEIARALGLPPRSVRGLLLGVTAADLVICENARYSNHSDVASLVGSVWWDHFAKTLRFEAEIVYPGQVRFVECLRSGLNLGIDAIAGTGEFYHRLAANPKLSSVFYDYMSRLVQYCEPMPSRCY